MLTIKDIAKKVGVSYATVSRALNGHPEVNIETRKKILKIANEIGYQPNAIAQGLVKKMTRTIGLLIPDITNPFFPEVARGIEDAANDVGYTIFLCNTNWSEQRELYYLNVLKQKCVDGIIISPSSENPEHLKQINSCTNNVIFISRTNYLNSTSILIDNFRGAQMAVEHLLSKGRSKIAFIGGLKDISANQERLEGYKSALENNRININDDFICNSDFKRESGFLIMEKLLKNKKDYPDAVFAANDLLALGVIQSIKKNDLKIPKDIAVIGFDDIEFASLPEIQLTTIAQPKYDMGKMAMQSLVSQIDGENNMINKKIMLEPVLIVRGTT